MGCGSSKQNTKEKGKRRNSENAQSHASRVPDSSNHSGKTLKSESMPEIPVSAPPPENIPINKNLPKMIAEYDYQKRSVADLDFKKGEIFYLLDKSNDDWFQVMHVTSGKQGYVPSNFLAPYEENKPRDTVESASWYFAQINRVDSEQLLTMCEVPGTYLIRPSENATAPYTLSILDSNRRIKHYRIKYTTESGYCIAGDIYFGDLFKLIEYYSSGEDSNVPKLIKVAPKAEPETAGLGKDIWEVSRGQIELLSKLGSGNFGEVWKGLFNKNTQVAVKTFKEGKMNPEEFLKEANIMKTIKHKKLVRLLAVCTVGRPLLIICEFMENGSLKDYLPPRKNNISYSVLLSMCIQCCEGMAYMESVNMIHRDLAARNILISKNLECKIADFGMSVIATEKSEQGSQNSKIPIRWTAPEAIKKGQFSNKSDVWSYGVLAWEIMTFCQLPYPNMNNQETLTYVFDGKILSKPDMCTDSVYQTLSLCWAKLPDDRPTFCDLLKKMNEEVKKLQAAGGLYNEL